MKNRNCWLFFEFDVIITSLWRHFCHVGVILWHFTTKILKPSILIAWKWLIHILNIFWVWQIWILNLFSNSTSLWRHFCYFDVIKKKNRTHATLTANSTFQHFVVVKIQIFGYFSNLTPFWHHFCHVGVILQFYCTLHPKS